jgi:hypothetical protein
MGSGITYITVQNGFMYLYAALDIYSRMILPHSPIIKLLRHLGGLEILDFQVFQGHYGTTSCLAVDTVKPSGCQRYQADFRGLGLSNVNAKKPYKQRTSGLLQTLSDFEMVVQEPLDPLLDESFPPLPDRVRVHPESLPISASLMPSRLRSTVLARSTR